MDDRTLEDWRKRTADFSARYGLRIPICQSPVAGACPVELATAIAAAVAMEPWARSSRRLTECYGDNSLRAAVSEAATPYLISQLTGDWQSVPDFLDTQHRLVDVGDAQAYLARLEAFGAALDQETERVRADAARGVILPGFALESVLVQMRALRGTPAGQTRLVRALVERGATAGISGDLGREATTLVEREVTPAAKEGHRCSHRSDRPVGPRDHERGQPLLRRAGAELRLQNRPLADRRHAGARRTAARRQVRQASVRRRGDLRGKRALGHNVTAGYL